MEERIIDSIIAHLHRLLPNILCQHDEYWQESDEPSFFLYLIQVEQSDDLGPYFYDTYMFDLLFDPRPSGTPNKDCREMAGFLRFYLREVPRLADSGFYYGHNIQSRIADGLLHVTFDVRAEYRTEEDEAPEIESVRLDFEEEKENNECILKERF